MPLNVMVPETQNGNRLLSYAAFLGILLALLAIFFSGTSNKASAQPTSFCYDQTAGATTTLSYITPGTGTTTLTIANCRSAEGLALDGAIVQMQLTASSTATAYKMRVEDSFDGIDWYSVAAPLASTATTTTETGSFSDVLFNFATTTADTAASGVQSRVNESISIPVTAPYIRVKFYLPVGSANGAVWAQIVGQREVR